jgi:hypothetical protein
VEHRDRPDFSGEWVLNRKVSILSPGADAVESGVWQIEHREPTFRHKATFVSETAVSFWYELIDAGRRLRALEQVRGTDHDQDNIWFFDRG